jgi:glycine/D-amino acid oxidase-like deaminating enzyme
VRIFPHLSSVQLNRAWGALRVMTPDGYPVYHQSTDYPGAYAVSCHSGVTLAALHAVEIANWICGDTPHELTTDFSAARFDVSTDRQ